MTHPPDLPTLFERHGHAAYAGEAVTQWQHAWQCAQLARRAGATPALQAGAWLHDVGHLLDGDVDTPTMHGHDDRHEERAAALLRPLFGAAVAGPVGLHVDAKRYLVSTRPGYLERLSADSRRSLALQGGPMNADEARHWREQPHAVDAVRLRVWDDAAKDGAWAAPSLRDGLAELRALLAACEVRL